MEAGSTALVRLAPNRTRSLPANIACEGSHASPPTSSVAAGPPFPTPQTNMYIAWRYGLNIRIETKMGETEAEIPGWDNCT
jgi:hypothetical protein